MENLLKQMKNDPELQVSEEEMDAWANEIAEKGYHYLEGKKYDILEKEKADALCDYSDEVRSKWLDLLQHYRLVYDIQDLIPHQHIRWISWSKKRPAVETDPQYGNELHSGGFLPVYDLQILVCYVTLCLIFRKRDRVWYHLIRHWFSKK
jgi:hypothetical protein